MSRKESPPFERGKFVLVDTSAYSNLEGQEYEFEDRSPNSPTARSGALVKCRVVRWTQTAFSPAPKRIAAIPGTAGYRGSRSAGYTTTTSAAGLPIDEYLPSSITIPSGKEALIWCVVSGPAMVLTPVGGADFPSDIAAGDLLAALTAVTSGATTSGRVTKPVLTATSQATDYAFLANAVMNRIGVALSARTTAETNSDLLIDVGRWG